MQDSMTNMFAAVHKAEADFKVHMQEVNSLKDKLNEPSDAFITDMQAMQKRLYTENKTLEQQNKTLTAALSKRNEELVHSKESNDFITVTLAERDRELKDSKEHYNDVQSRKDQGIWHLKENIKSLEKNQSDLANRYKQQHELDIAKPTEKDIIIQQASNDKVRLELELAEAHEKLKDLEGKITESDMIEAMLAGTAKSTSSSIVNQPSVSQRPDKQRPGKRKRTEETDQTFSKSSAGRYPSKSFDRILYYKYHKSGYKRYLKPNPRSSRSFERIPNYKSGYKRYVMAHPWSDPDF
jgi:hypothetical protein